MSWFLSSKGETDNTGGMDGLFTCALHVYVIYYFV